MYLSDHSKNLISAEEKVAELIKQRDQIRNELAAERARLDWMESDAGMDFQWGTVRVITRTAIDAAMKEETK
jgi:hypothetical protein